MPIAMEEQHKWWKIALTSRNMTEKVIEAKKVQPEVIKESQKHLQKNSGLIDAFLDTPMVRWDPQWTSDKPWRVKE